MALNLSKEEREQLKKDLAAAEPYDKDDPIFEEFDGEMTNERRKRWRATMARDLLEQDDKEKAERKNEQ